MCKRHLDKHTVEPDAYIIKFNALSRGILIIILLNACLKSNMRRKTNILFVPRRVLDFHV